VPPSGANPLDQVVPTPTALSRRGRLARQRARTGYLFVAPAVVVLLLTNLVPILVAFYLSFTRYDLLHPPSFAGLQNYQLLLNGASFIDAVGRTLYFTITQVPAGTVLAILAALLLNGPIAGRGPLRTAIYLPQATSYVVVALIWSFLYDPMSGPLDLALKAIGIGPVYWLTDPNLAMPAIVILSIWRNLGYYMVIYLAALQAVPRELHEAAAIDGATSFGRFRHITLPLLTPVTAFVLITWSIGAMQMFTQAYVMTGGGPVDATTTVVYRVYQAAFLFLQMGQASAMAFALFVVVAAMTLLSRSILMREESVS